MTPTQLRERKKRVKKVIPVLQKLFPAAGMILRYSNEWELLVAVMLSAQCTDVMVNKVTERLFKKYPSLGHYLRASPEEFEQDIFSTGFYRSKARRVLAAARMISEQFGGRCPSTMEDMLSLPGVARKTANVVLGNAFGITEGIAVDTHVKRLSRALGLTDEHDPHKIEQDLMKIVPRSEWFHFTYLLIDFGRNHCLARRHDHVHCLTLLGLK